MEPAANPENSTGTTLGHARARSPFEVVTPIRTRKRDRTRSDSPRRTQPQQVRTADQLLGLGYQQGFPTTTAPPPVLGVEDLCIL